MRIIGCLIMMYMMFAHSDIAANAARRALHIYGLEVFPTLFPYMVLTRALVSGAQSPSIGLVVVFSLLGGSPSGASILDTYASRHSMHRKELLTLCTLTGTISPAFLINTAGSWFKDSRMTLLLVISHFTGAAASAMLVYLFMPDDQPVVIHARSDTSERNTNIISACILPVLSVGGCLVFFSVLSEIISTALFHTYDVPSAFTHALLEVSAGVKKLSEQLTQKKHMRYILISFSCGFSGLSILSQNAMFLRKHSVSVLHLSALGGIRGCLSAGSMWILMTLYAN